MNCWKKPLLTGMISVVLVLTTLTSTSEATWLRNWLAGRNRVQTTYYGSGGLFRGGLLSRFHRNPTVAYYPVADQAACCQPWQTTSQRQVVQYVPQTTYRKVWNRVPTTVYRPVVSVDPCNSCQTVSYRPCTTYQYQAQQVAYTSYRPVVRTISYQSPSCCAPTAAAPAFYGAPAATVVPGAACSSCDVTQGWVPSTSSGAAPMVVPSPQPDPTYAPEDSSGQPSSGDPADQPPSLNPHSTFPPNTSNGTATHSQGAGFRPSYNTASPAVAQPPVSIPALRPLPNLDGEPSNIAPELVAPGERTAHRRLRVRLASAVSEIAWPAADTKSKRANVSLHGSNTSWDDTGWHSAR